MQKDSFTNYMAYVKKFQRKQHPLLLRPFYECRVKKLRLSAAKFFVRPLKSYLNLITPKSKVGKKKKKLYEAFHEAFIQQKGNNTFHTPPNEKK